MQGLTGKQWHPGGWAGWLGRGLKTKSWGKTSHRATKGTIVQVKYRKTTTTAWATHWIAQPGPHEVCVQPIREWDVAGCWYILYEVQLSVLSVGHLPVLRQRPQRVFWRDLRLCEGLLPAVWGGGGRIVQTTGWSIVTHGVRPEDAAAALVRVVRVTCAQQRRGEETTH